MVSVWTAACATGQETCSFAMMLVEHARTLEMPPTIQVFGCDLDAQAIQAARAGVYPPSIVADVSEERIQRFFSKDVRGYRVRRELSEVDAPAKALRILVVEDHRDTLTYLTMYLESLGHVVGSAQTVKDAREFWDRAEYDVLISDIGLPDGDSWELLRRIRAHSPRPFFPMAMSGFGLNADHLRSKDAGDRHHLLKPFEPEKLNLLLMETACEPPPAPQATG